MLKVNGINYILVERTKEENKTFIDLLTTAEDKLSLALCDIAYSSFPPVNNSIICELKSIIGNISRIEYNVGKEGGLYRPEKVCEESLYYYELHYFRSRKDNGSIFVKSVLNIEDYADEDKFLLALISKHELNSELVDSIVRIDHVDEETYIHCYSEGKK